MKKETEGKFKVPNSSLFGCGTVSTGKGWHSTGENCSQLQDRAVQE